MAFNPLNSAKSSFLSGVQKGVNQSQGTNGSSFGSSAAGLIDSLAQSLFEVGSAFNTVSAVTSLKIDSVIAGGETGFVSGKSPERAAAGDLEAGRNSRGINQSMSDYKINTDPTGVIAKNKSHGGGTSYYPLAWASDKYYMTLRFFDYDRKDLFREAKNTPKYTVTLPLPSELNDSQRTEYSTADMKTVGTLMTEGATKSAGLQAVMTAGPAVANKLIGGLADKVGAKNKMLAGTLSTFGAGAEAAGVNTENLVNAIEQYMGMAPNPQPSILLKGPSLREFNFTWTFNPRDVDESKRIRETIERLKASALPRKSFAGSGTGVLLYPQVCMLNFYPWDGSANKNSIYGWGEKSLIRIKRCFISNITSNYSPNGVPSFFAGTVGAPVFIQLSMALKEIEFFTSEDWLSYNASEIGGSSLDLNEVFGGSVIGKIAGLASKIVDEAKQ